MRHIILLDPIEKLVIKKDSTLLMALTFQEKGEEVYLLFEKDFSITNNKSYSYEVHKFSGEIKGDQYLDHFVLGDSEVIELKKGDVFHMRLDPPFDARYLRVCWMLKEIKKVGVTVINDPEGIILNNEKLMAFSSKESLPTYVGAGFYQLSQFVGEQLTEGIKDFILKPLDLYQGIGVTKYTYKDERSLKDLFIQKVSEFKGAVVVQPFVSEISKGEVRALYYNGQEIGTILKVPKSGEYLANIAQGASFSPYELTQQERLECERISKVLSSQGVPFIAFDILNHKISEVNITCPGLLVEVSHAHERNLASKILELLE